MNIKHNNEKKYYEKRAQLTLLHFFHSIYSQNIIMSDKPDLIDNDNSVGIEVTRSFYNDFAEISGLSKKCMKKNIDEISEKTLNYLQKMNSNPVLINDIYCGYTLPAQWVTTSYIENCFIDKITKLNNGGYDKLNFYDLYIYSPGFDEYDSNEIKEFLNKINNLQKNYNIKYRYVFIDDESIIYQCDLLNIELIAHKINKNTLQKICIGAKEFIN